MRSRGRRPRTVTRARRRSRIGVASPGEDDMRRGPSREGIKERPRSPAAFSARRGGRFPTGRPVIPLRGSAGGPGPRRPPRRQEAREDARAEPSWARAPAGGDHQSSEHHRPGGGQGHVDATRGAWVRAAGGGTRARARRAPGARGRRGGRARPALCRGGSASAPASGPSSRSGGAVAGASRARVRIVRNVSRSASLRRLRMARRSSAVASPAIWTISRARP